MTQLALPFASRRSMHRNSLEAYSEELPRLGARCKMIYDFVKASGKAWTIRELATHFGHPENLNFVAPRVNDLIAAGLLTECGNTKCAITQKTVRLVRAKE